MSERPDEGTTCDGCGDVILRKVDRVEAGGRVFCGDVCADSFMDEHTACGPENCEQCECICHTT